MKQMLKRLSLTLLVSCSPMMLADTAAGHPFFSVRSQSTNAARELVGWQEQINRFEADGIHGTLTVTPEFTRSFRPNQISEFFFGDDLIDKNSIKLSGSRVATRGEKDWMADYFGLIHDFESTISFTPRITNFLVDFNFYLGLDELVEGSFFRIHAPIVHVRTDMNLKEANVSQGATPATGFQNGYMAGVGPATTATTPLLAALPADFVTAIKGTTTFGDMQEALKYGKIDGRQTKTALSDIEAALGMNFLMDEDYHFGLMLRGAAPTGTKPDAEWLFEPIVGSGKHWQLGGGMTAKARLWTSADEEKSFTVYADANVMHMFKARQKRSFDLKSKPQSRYMLISELAGSNDGLLFTNAAFATTAGSTAPTSQYQGRLFNLINKSTLDCDVRIAVQGDLAIKFAYVHGNFAFDLGYNLWGRSGEKITLKEELDANKYALKGDAHVYGFAQTVAGVPATTVGQAIALSSSQNNATIHSGTNRAVGAALVITETDAAPGIASNRGVDNIQYGRLLAAGAAADDISISQPVVADNQQATSNNPIFIATKDLDDSDTESAVSHKVFGHFNYTFLDNDDWTPFVGVGAEAEFGGVSSSSNSISQWGVWAKGGLSFN